MYQLPLKFIQVSPDVAICATRIVAIMSTKSYQARKTITAERSAGTLINGCGDRKAETAIFLDNGSVISSPYTIPSILKRIEKASGKKLKGEPYAKNGISVYDPDPIEEDVSEEESADIDEEYTEEDIDCEEPVDE